jgi:serine/threonine protein kinase
MGEVYLAEDTKLDRKVALKILPADVASGHDRMDRFVREAKSAAALNIFRITALSRNSARGMVKSIARATNGLAVRASERIIAAMRRQT